MKSILNGLCHIGIPCKNLSESTDFYKKLGFSEAYSNNRHRAVFLGLNNLIIELYEMVSIKDQVGVIDHVAISCDDVESCYDEVIKMDLIIKSDGIDERPFWENGIRFFIVEGPNKERIEFCQRL